MQRPSFPLVSSTLIVFFVFYFTGALSSQALTVSDVCPYNWTRNLKVGSVGDDVLKLQQFLNTDSTTAIAVSGPGSAGMEVKNFGTLTARAVIKFQEKYKSEILASNGLSKGTGSVGASTRAKLNSLCQDVASSASPSAFAPTLFAAAAASSVGTPADVLTVSDPEQPASSIAPAGAGVLFLNFDLTAGSKDVVVKEVTLERVGMGMDAGFASLGLWDEQGLQIGNVVTLNSIHRVVFRTLFTIPAGKTQKYQIYANMASDLSSYDSQMPALQLVGISASSAVAGTLPLRGTTQTLNASLVIGGATATLSQFDPGEDRTHYVNDTGIRFSGIRMTANSQEDITLSNIIWTQAGTASNGDIAHVVTVVNGVSYLTEISHYSSREYVTTFDPGIVIKKGDSVDVYVKGDLTVSGANRTVKFDIRDINDEVSLSGNQYGFGVGLAPGGNTATTGNSVFLTDTGDPDGTSLQPFFSGSVTTISAGASSYIGKN